MAKDRTGLGAAAKPLLAAVLLLGTQGTHAHPAHAKPVNYPFVVGFERFHSGLDDEDYLAEGGFLLLNELNCVACHAAPEPLRDQFPGVVATNLDGVASRLAPVELEIFIRNPRFAKRDTTMPSLFAGPDRDLDEVAALRAWLGTLTSDLPAYPVGDIGKGRALYHRIGCVACHAPENGYRPPGIPENAEIEMAGLASVPMNLADFYDLGALTHFLLHPNEHRPSGRMPDFALSVADAADLAAYLKAGPDLVLPANLTEALAADAPTADAALVAKGRELFFTKQCNACHRVPGKAATALAGPSAKPLAGLSPDATGGCFSERPSGGPVPFYGLDLVQKRALAAALRRLPGRAPLDPPRELDWRLKQLNCYACHELAGTGGPETSREVYFGFRDAAAVALGRDGHLPPPLDEAASRFAEAGILPFLTGVGRPPSPRPHLLVPMPRFREDIAAPFGRLLPIPGKP
jgi:mono/diheme cytochrome c family protein